MARGGRSDFAGRGLIKSRRMAVSGCKRILCQPAIDHMNLAMHLRGEAEVVCNRDHRLAVQRHQIAKDSEYLGGGDVSRLPVGSSARMTGGSLASARATATRCRCPPDN